MPFIKDAKDLKKREIGDLVRLRTGHIGLNAFLARIGKATTAKRNARGTHNETVAHYLLHCPAYKQQRIEMLSGLGRQANTHTTASKLQNGETSICPRI
ncbi:hypothetical protein AX17_006789 [Amanita inopinata Kibby_2008]|nr:hypothetical protein AX17_006789 [Amanita inopinata Kibby_2008]